MIPRLFGAGRPRGPRVLVFVDLPQDVEVLVPVIRALSDDPAGFDLRIAVSRWLRTDHPGSLAPLAKLVLPLAYVRRREVIAGVAPDLRAVDALITASESSHPAHAAGHALARRGGAEGARTYTLQHGLENVGLIGAESQGWDLASERVFCWFPPAMAEAAPEAVRERLLHVGRPRALQREDAAARYDVGVFENLHAERYADDDRAHFVAGLEALAATGAAVLLRPHPAGRWSAGLDLRPWPNLVLDAGGGGVRAAVDAVARVITTPSTVILDAAQAGKPVALAVEGGPLYRPFPVLGSPDDWIAFIRSVEGQAEARDAFLARMLLPGDAAPRIAATLRRDLSDGLAQQGQVC